MLNFLIIICQINLSLLTPQEKPDYNTIMEVVLFQDTLPSYSFKLYSYIPESDSFWLKQDNYIERKHNLDIINKKIFFINLEYIDSVKFLENGFVDYIASTDNLNNWSVHKSKYLYDSNYNFLGYEKYYSDSIGTGYIFSNKLTYQKLTDSTFLYLSIKKHNERNCSEWEFLGIDISKYRKKNTPYYMVYNKFHTENPKKFSQFYYDVSLDYSADKYEYAFHYEDNRLISEEVNERGSYYKILYNYKANGKLESIDSEIGNLSSATLKYIIKRKHISVDYSNKNIILIKGVDVDTNNLIFQYEIKRVSSDEYRVDYISYEDKNLNFYALYKLHR